METDTLGSSLSSISPGGKEVIVAFYSFFYVIFKMTFIFSLFFLMWIIFKVFIEFVAVSFFFFWHRGIWDLSPLTRDGTCNPYIGR